MSDADVSDTGGADTSGVRRPITTTITITVDRDACCAMGRCAATEPDLFDQDPATGTVVLLDPTPSSPELHASARLCADLCPCGAITVTEH
ncbi:ferredoxin [Streptomyces sp. NBC_01615]|uniref:ferredoxin n=1 Tax=Streptomyces sp. NBC_01615 TaxID=2975898 RepID=UPI0038678A5D